MYARFCLFVMILLVTPPLSAQVPAFPEGSQVIASPTMLPDRWEKCTVIRQIPASNGYELSCGAVKYVVPSRYVLDASEQNEALLIPPAARDLMPAGSEVVASPTYLPDRWERCSVLQPLYNINGYELKCGSVVYVVSRTQVLPATEDNVQLKLGASTNNSFIADDQATISTLNFPNPSESNAVQSPPTPSADQFLSSNADNYYPGMMIEASPLQGVWGDAVVIEKVEDGFRVQMLPGEGYVGAPQLILQSEQMREPGASKEDSIATQDLTKPNAPIEPLPQLQAPPEVGAQVDNLQTGQRVPNGTYYCGKSTGGMVFFMGDIELRDGFYRGPAYDGKFGDWYPMTTTPEGTINWGGPLPGFESDISRVVSTAIKSDGGNPSFDVILQMQSGNFMGISCVPK